jgi:hypothetical protein
MKITLSTGLELELQPVSQVAIDEIIIDLGGYELQWQLAALDDEALRSHFAGYAPAEMTAYLDAQHRQMLYCLGWGVADEPPPEAVDALRVLKRDSEFPQVRRAYWLFYVAGLTRADKALVIGGVMALTHAKTRGINAN